MAKTYNVELYDFGNERKGTSMFLLSVSEDGSSTKVIPVSDKFVRRARIHHKGENFVSKLNRFCRILRRKFPRNSDIEFTDMERMIAKITVD